MITGSIAIAGRLASDPVLSSSSKGKPVARILIEAESVRQVKRDEFKNQVHLIPITIYSWLVDDVKDLRQGTRLTVCCHVNGTTFTPEDGATRYGLQLIADSVTFPPARKEPNASSF
jgi:single-stranded DNA-binding protein